MKSESKEEMWHIFYECHKCGESYVSYSNTTPFEVNMIPEGKKNFWVFECAESCKTTEDKK